MTKQKLQRIKKRIEKLFLRPNNIRSAELVNLARSLERRLFDRGKEPTYVSDLLPKSWPISIPNHPGAMNRNTAQNILNLLSEDIVEIEKSIKE